MNRFTVLGIFIFILGPTIFGLSSHFIDEINSSVEHTQTSRTLLSANTQLQRSFAILMVGKLIDSDSLSKESYKALDAAKLLLNDGSGLTSLEKNKLKNYLEHIEKQSKKLILKVKNKKDLSKEAIIELAKSYEEISEYFIQKEREFYLANTSGFERILSNYKKVNLATFIVYTLLMLTLIMLIITLDKQRVLAKKIAQKHKAHGALFASLSESVFMCDGKGQVVACNNSAALLTGRDIREVVGKHINDLFHKYYLTDEESKLNYNGLIDIIEKGTSINNLVMIMYPTDDSVKWYSLNCQPMMENKSNQAFSMILSLADITEKMLVKKTVKEQQMKLLESSKLQAIGEMASGIAHEINNPLAIIDATTQRLARKAKRSDQMESEEVGKIAIKITKTVDRMARVIKGMLGISKGDLDEKSRISVYKLLQMSLDFCYAYAEKQDVKIDIESENTGVEVLCHTTEVSQVFLNLIKNSVDAVEELDERWIKVSTLTYDEFVEIRFLDSGKGISKELQEKILMPFFTTKKIGKGTGIGLSISRTIIEKHGGQLYIDEHNANTCFVVRLPINYIENNESLVG